MLKLTFSTLARLSHIKFAKNKLNTNGGVENSSVDGGKINNKFANLSNSIKKISSKLGYSNFKVCLTFT